MSIAYKDIPQPNGTTPFAWVMNFKTAWENWKLAKLASQGQYYTSLIPAGRTFAQLIATIGSTEATIWVNSAVTVAANLTIPANISIVVLKGGSFAISTGVTLTINGPFSAGDYKCFTFTGTGAVRGIAHWNAKWVAMGDGSTNDTTPLTKAMDCISANGGGSLYFPPSQYMTSSSLFPPSSCRIYGAGPGSHIKSVAGTTWSDTAILEIVDGVSHIDIEHLKLDGDAIGNAAQTGPDGAETRGRSYGINISGDVSDIRLFRVISTGHQAYNNTTSGGVLGGDGINIESSGSDRPQRVSILECDCDGNYRNGMSVIAVKGLQVINSWFRNTTGTDPGAGIDFEPNTTSPDTEDVYIAGCLFNANEKGLLLYDAQQKNFQNITVIGCAMRDNRDMGLQCQEITTGGVSIQGCEIRDNVNSGLEFRGANRAVEVSGCAIFSNGDNGIDIQNGSRYLKIRDNHITINGQHGIKVAHTFGGRLLHIIDGNTIYNNGVSAANTYDGIHFVGDASHDDFACLVTHNWIGNRSDIDATATQRDGIRISANANKVRVHFNTFEGHLGTYITNTAGDAFIEWNWNSNAFITGLSGSNQFNINSLHNFIQQPRFNGDFLTYTGASTSGVIPKFTGTTGAQGASFLSESGQTITHAGQELDLQSANSGGINSINAQNLSNTANSRARLLAKAGGASSGDAYVEWASGSTSITAGWDASAAWFAMAFSNALGTSDFLRVTSALDVAVQAGDLSIATAGKGIKIKEGSNAKAGTATLTAGTVTVSTTAVAAGDRILLWRQGINASTALGELTPGTITAATSFVINSYSLLAALETGDASTVYWEIRTPA